jgi:hypothetical protein
MSTALLTHEGTAARTVVAAGHGRLRRACHRVRMTVAEMNYAARRVVEVQAPWSVDEHWHTR